MVHPEIAKVVNPLKAMLQSKYSNTDNRCTISVAELLKREGKTVWENCPKCNVKDTAERTGMCWNFLCGRCKHGAKCKFVHVRPDELPQPIVTGLVSVIAAPIAKKLEEDKHLPNIKKIRAGETAVSFG